MKNWKWIPLAVISSLLTACAHLPSSGAGKDKVLELASPEQPGSDLIRVLDVNDVLARRLRDAEQRNSLAEVFGVPRSDAQRVGPGDYLEVSIWEAPPALLFVASDVRTTSGTSTAARVTTLPEQMIQADGNITVPFVGALPVKGRTPREIEADIVRRLQGKANAPQVLVRLTRNMSANVTVVGEVSSSLRMPLTAKGERLLDAVAAAGGVRQPVGKVTIQLARDGRVQSMSLDGIIQDPKQNVLLQPDDVVTALHQPLSFTALGATGKNEELAFEAQGISLTQALARVGGLADQRADAQGVFIFRYEKPEALGALAEGSVLTPDGRVPVVYRFDLKDPRTFFVAQSFPVHHRDVMYVANAPVAEFQKFMSILTSIVFTANGLGNIR